MSNTSSVGSSSQSSSSSRSSSSSASPSSSSSKASSSSSSAASSSSETSSTSSAASESSTPSASTSDQSTISDEAGETASASASASVEAISRGLAETPASGAGLQEAMGTGTLRSGMNSEAVGALQGALNDRLGTSLETDGKFGAKTADAVRAFQQQQGLTVDGIVGEKTREALLSGGTAATEATSGAETTAEAGEAGVEAQVDPTKPREATEYAALQEALGDGTLEPGSRDPKAVSALQNALNDLLGTDMAVDGKFGNDTRDAVKQFQQQQGLEADGIVGEDTREALLGPQPPATREQLQDREAARQQAASETAPDMIFGDRISAEDQTRVRELAAELQTSPNDLMAVFGVETGGTFDPAERANGTTNGAVGLIQFTQTAVDAMNQRREQRGQEPISKDDLAGMSFSDQLVHVGDYLRDTMSERGVSGPVGRDELYTAVFAPSAITRSDGASIYRRGSDAYASNSSLDTDRNGHITRQEITDRVDQWYNIGMSELNS